MSVVNQFGKLFNRKPEESDTGLGADVIGGGQNVLTTGSIEGNTMRESYQTDAMSSVQGDPDGGLRIIGHIGAPVEHQCLIV